MTVTYHRDVLYTIEEALVHLKFIESIAFKSNYNDLLVDKIKDDVCLLVRTVSGTDHVISVNVLIKTGNYTCTQAEMVEAVYDKWCHFHRLQTMNP